MRITKKIVVICDVNNNIFFVFLTDNEIKSYVFRSRAIFYEVVFYGRIEE